jgi:hypothetical protein
MEEKTIELLESGDIGEDKYPDYYDIIRDKTTGRRYLLIHNHKNGNINTVLMAEKGE